MSCDTTPNEWIGWQRLNGAKVWQAVTRGATEREASPKLWDLPLPAGTRHHDSVVLPAGQDPNVRKRPR